MKKRSILQLLAFLCFMFGFLTLLLSLLGLEFSYLAWLDRMPGLMPLMVKLGMLFGGIVLAYLSSTDWRRQD